MCRNITTLYNIAPAATEDEARAAALKYVRKVSGYTKPSKANEEAFQQAVDDVAAITWRLINQLETSAAPRERKNSLARITISA